MRSKRPRSGLLLGHVVPPALGGGVHKDELLVVYGDEVDAVRACAQFSSSTSRPLCFRHAWIASCDLSSILFPMAVCLLVLVPATFGAPCGVDGARGKAAVQGVKAKRGCA